MKIFEIVEPKTVEKLRSQPFDIDYQIKHHNKHWNLYNTPRIPPAGRGLYSKGRTNLQDPFMFSKSTVRLATEDELKDDGYFNWVQAIKPYISSNPYLPRVYVIKMEKDSNGLIKVKYQIEKLLSIDQLGPDDVKDELLRSMTRRIFKNVSPSTRPEVIMSLIGNAPYADARDRIKDPKLIEALEIIDRVLSSNKKNHGGMYLDLHAGNILFRRTAQGVWPVLSDPIG